MNPDEALGGGGEIVATLRVDAAGVSEGGVTVADGGELAPRADSGGGRTVR